MWKYTDERNIIRKNINIMERARKRLTNTPIDGLLVVRLRPAPSPIALRETLELRLRLTPFTTSAIALRELLELRLRDMLPRKLGRDVVGLSAPPLEDELKLPNGLSEFSRSA